MQSAKALVLAALLLVSVSKAAQPTSEHQFEPLVSTRSTAALVAREPAAVQWMMSSDVVTVEASSLDPTDPGVAHFLRDVAALDDRAATPIYRYRYIFESTSAVPVRFNFSDPRVVNSPLVEILQDFSFALQPGQTRTIQFLTTESPAFVVSPVNNGIWDSTRNRWGVLGTRPASLYVPSLTGPTYVERE